MGEIFSNVALRKPLSSRASARSISLVSRPSDRRVSMATLEILRGVYPEPAEGLSMTCNEKPPNKSLLRLLTRNLFQRLFEHLIWLCADNGVPVIDHVGGHAGHANLIRPADLVYNRSQIFFVFHLALHFVRVQAHFLGSGA